MKLFFQQHRDCWVAVLLIVFGLLVGLALPIQQLHWQPRVGHSVNSSLTDLVIIGSQNLRLGFGLLVGAITLGLYGVIQFFTIGFSLAMTLKAGLSAGVTLSKILLFLAPHSVIEFSGFVLIGALEFEAARIAYRKLRYDLIEIDRPRVIVLSKQALLGVSLIVVAAFIEVYVTLPLARYLFG